MKKTVIRAMGVAALFLSISCVVKAAPQTGGNIRIGDHEIYGGLYSESYGGRATTDLVASELNCKDGLYTYIEALDINGNRTKPGSEQWQWDTTQLGEATVYDSSSIYLSSRHTTCTQNNSRYLSLRR